MSNPSSSGSLANLVATIDSVAAGGSGGSFFHDDHHNEEDTQHHHHVLTAADLMEDGTVGMLEGTVLHLSNGQSINVVQMSGSLEDAINVVQVETTELGEHDVGEMCEIDIDTEEQQHILSETGAHVVVKTENAFFEKDTDHQDHDHDHGSHRTGKSSISVVHPTVPFSFPGQTFDTKCQKLILNVWDFFRRVKKNPDLLDEIRTPQERAAAALHISAATIGKIGKNFKRTGKLETPGKKRKRTKPVVDSVSPEQEQVIRGIIKELKENRVAPTLPLILSECRDRINFQGGATSFRRVLHRMGYKGLSNKPSSSHSSSKIRTTSSTSSLTSSSNAHSNSKTFVSAEPIAKKERYVSIPLTSPVSHVQSPRKMTMNKTKTSNASMSFSSTPTTVPISISKQNASKLVSNLLGNNIFQLSSGSKGESITISQQTANAIANAASGLGDGPQTIHVLNPDNTVQQIQIVYANI